VTVTVGCTDELGDRTLHSAVTVAVVVFVSVLVKTTVVSTSVTVLVDTTVGTVTLAVLTEVTVAVTVKKTGEGDEEMIVAVVCRTVTTSTVVVVALATTVVEPPLVTVLVDVLGKTPRHEQALTKAAEFVQAA